ncbi:MAG: ligand-binding sensor domain-containing diguanylate cyclase [Acidobacteriota bacterium]
MKPGRIWRPVAAAVVAAAFCVPAARALDPRKAPTQYIHSYWLSEDGLPQNSVTAILQDRTGYLWLATQEGIVRFDGVSFTVFDKWNTPAIVRNNIRDVCLDASGTLWAGTNGGGLLRMENGAFTVLDSKDGLVFDNVTSLCGTRDGAVWAGTYGGGLSRYKDGVFTNFTTREGLPHNSILTLYEDPITGDLWIGTNGGGLCRFAGGRFETVPGLPEPVVYAVHRGRDGTLWIGTYNQGLCALQNGRLRVYTTKDGLTSDRITCLLEDRDGNLWVGTFGGGLSRLHEGRWSSFTTRDGLPYDVVRALCEDGEGNLWIGTNGGGLNCLHDGPFATFGVPEGLSNDFAIGLLETRDGSLWISTNGGGINRFKDGRFTRLTTAEGMPNDLIRSLCEDRSGALWVGTDGGGLARVQNGKITTLTTADGLPTNRVIAVYEDRRGILWAGTNGGGLCRIEGRAIQSFSPTGASTGGLVNLIFEDSRGRLWVSTYGGLSLFENGRFTGFEGREAIGNAIVTHMHEDARGALWIGTIGSGVFLMRGSRVDRISKAQGLPDDTAYQILEDDLGHVWMSGNRGVYRARIQDMVDCAEGRLPRVPVTEFGVADGMRSAECNGGFVPAGIRARDGRLWFPTIRGVVVVDPDERRFNAQPPPVLVERVVVNGVPREAAAEIVLPPGRNRLDIHYTGLSFVAPERVQFRYVLEGFDPDWVRAETRRVATYTNLPPGKYTFRVTACNNDGVWNAQGASLTLVQKPRFYQTAPFLFLCIVAGVALLAGAVRLRVRSLEARRVVLEALVEERTRELRTANDRLAELSAQDPLTGLANRRRFDAHIEAQWRQLARTGGWLSLLMADLDGFKAYNDTYGHPAGDAALVRVAALLAEAANRAGDLAARYGGEEFALVLTGTDIQNAEALAESLRAAVAALSIAHAGLPGGVLTLSLGVATVVPDPALSWRTLVDSADQALYRAKQEGRNRVCTARDLK